MNTAAILNNASASGLSSGIAKPMSTSGSSSDSSTTAATVSANDFLTLLVTELKNQDPTANRDPNEYIDQLVAVNSLQQLIGINETLTDAYGTSTASTQSVTTRTSSLPATLSTAGTDAAQSAAGVITRNPTAPSANASATRIAQALDGK